MVTAGRYIKKYRQFCSNVRRFYGFPLHLPIHSAIHSFLIATPKCIMKLPLQLSFMCTAIPQNDFRPRRLQPLQYMISCLSLEGAPSHNGMKHSLHLFYGPLLYYFTVFAEAMLHAASNRAVCVTIPPGEIALASCRCRDPAARRDGHVGWRSRALPTPSSRSCRTRRVNQYYTAAHWPLKRRL